MVERASLQHRDARRDAAELPPGGAPRDGALPRGGVVRGGGHGTARLSPAADEPRVAGLARPRHLRLPPRHRLGLDCPFARPRPARPQAPLPLPARAGAELLRRLCRLHRTTEGVRPGGSEDDATRLRLASVDEECVEGRADADRFPAQEDQDLGSEISPPVAKLQGLPGGE